MLERFSRPARAVVERAVVLATEARAAEVRPEHLFAAVLEDHDSVAVRALGECGGDVERLERDLDRRRSRYADGLDDDDAAALASIGIDLEEVLRRLDEADPGRGDEVGRRRTRRRFSRGSKKVLELALREAIALRHDHIGTEHLLLGLVRQDDAVVRGTLADADVDVAALRGAVAEAVRRAG